MDGEPVGVRLQGAEFNHIGFSWKPKVGDGPRRSVTATATDGRFVVRIPAGSHRLRLHGAVGNATELLLPTEIDSTCRAPATSSCRCGSADDCACR